MDEKERFYLCCGVFKAYFISFNEVIKINEVVDYIEFVIRNI